MRRTGLVLTGWSSSSVCSMGGARLAGFAPYVQGMPKFGYDPALAPWIGLSLLVHHSLCRSPYRSAGRRPADRLPGRRCRTQVRVGDPWFLFPAMMGALAWAGLWCRSPQLRELLPLVG